MNELQTNQFWCRLSSRTFVLALTCAAALFDSTCVKHCWAQVEPVNVAIERGVDFLLSQQKESGAITDTAHETAMTSLSIMAMASVGQLPNGNNERSEKIRRALNFVLREDRQDSFGYFGAIDNSRMYGHGITTLMLTEIAGMSPDPETEKLLHQRCQKGIDLILASQRRAKPPMNRGGWRYTPDAIDADLSVSVWQLLALRSAKNDGMEVSSSSIDSAIGYLKRSYSSKLDSAGKPVNPEAGFCYTPDQNSPSFAMTAAGLLAMQVCGEYESPLLDGAESWLMKHPPKWEERFVLYGVYYFAQGMHQRGGQTAEQAEKIVTDLLLPKQGSDGSWQAPNGEEHGAGRVYGTSMAILSLSVKYHYLPIYQR